ncbi:MULTISPECIES: multidrug efflux SMR transporter [Paenibacillus]|jgi:paired small multidrug resistance pump|uniref:QacE family quaternary ammonium compound efflux SMR transporter n=1 Tax=Paenibacillus odorifer TaxID=189426 RepID=A0ABX3GGI2_9BACL|nr:MULTISPECIES: multidrug efflux SMR transporter [Paenibacillus]MDH6425920.1 paired small multidrug resistance pump [Paenibacillus sp. PastH-4]MDH6441941.1 paired small multidrug resistance pump [Paenibacillus sp. PastF-4]MDH6527344.1 paired small multidrug resistance pump [Paenibacillus sp. PastH-3]OMC65219.1 QacE family quaternary ammonium compound efflux SMR transporter [Paenibacillus odorifer]OMC79895.1 QacE family quaternary ammonium compound efflux SMR transporter [Paenibacillus odorife
MAWAFLVVAGLFEMFGVAMINRLNKYRNLQSFLLLFLGFGGSFLFLSFAMKSLPMGTAYAVWTGIGASGGAILGMLLYGEAKDWRRVICIFMILGAAVGLKLIA